MVVKVSSKYQIVIPEEIRSALSIVPGREVDIIAKNGVACIVPVKSMANLRENFTKTKSLRSKPLRDKKDRKLSRN